jgi:hypothetical protein
LVEAEIAVALQGEDRHFKPTAQDYITNRPVAEGLDVMDNGVNLASFNFGFDIFQAAAYGVRVSKVRILRRQAPAGKGHGELTLYFVKDDMGVVALQKAVKLASENWWHAYKSKAQNIVLVWLAPAALCNQGLYICLIAPAVLVEIGGGD